MQVTIEAGGKMQNGYSGDCLPPSWFDKSPGKSFSHQIDDMLAVIKLAEKTFAEELASETDFFQAFMIAYERIHSRAAEWRLTPLLASFGVSMVERALLDAMCRVKGVSFFNAARANLFGIVPSDLHTQLGGVELADCLPERPSDKVFVRHTVGLSDPLTAADLPDDERLDDGFPQTLEEYITQTGLRYFKIKVSNQLDHDIGRLGKIVELVERQHGQDYKLTLDGNEQYKTAADFQKLIETIHSTTELQTMWANTICIEQPLERSIALDPDHTGGICELAAQKAVIIDESDGTFDSYLQAIEVGYRGTSSKSCKGPIKSLTNACLTWLYNERGATSEFLMTGEDLCTVGIVPVQSDLCLTTAIGLTHVERNGHHYHPGLSYLPKSQRAAALDRHGDFYFERSGIVAPHLVDGCFQTGSLQCVGFGFDVAPDMDSMESADEWQFDSLGLDES